MICRTLAELQQFCQQRKLAVSKTTKKRELITALEEADENARFEGFSELPAELRVCVYEILFQDLREELAKHCQPPITRATRLIRRESLPVFYDANRVAVGVCKELFASRWFFSPIIHGLSQITPEILPRVPESAIGQFKKLLLSITVFDHVGGGAQCRWEIDLPARSKKCVKDVHRPKHHGNFRLMKDRAGLCIQQMLDRIAAREGHKILQKGDLEAMLRVADGFEAS